MEINGNRPVGNPLQESATTPPVAEVRREKEDASDRPAVRTEASPDYQVSLSETAKKAAAPPVASPPPDGAGDLSEPAAAQLSQQAAAQLSRTNMAIANQAMQKAVDLFT